MPLYYRHVKSFARATPVLRVKQVHDRIRVDPTPDCGIFHVFQTRVAPPSSSGPGHLVLSQKTGVRFPVGVLVSTGPVMWNEGLLRCTAPLTDSPCRTRSH